MCVLVIGNRVFEKRGQKGSSGRRAVVEKRKKRRSTKRLYGSLMIMTWKRLGRGLVEESQSCVTNHFEPFLRGDSVRFCLLFFSSLLLLMLFLDETPCLTRHGDRKQRYGQR